MADQTYEILGKTVRVVPDFNLPARLACEACAFNSYEYGQCPKGADLPEGVQGCVGGEHHYVEVQ